MSELKLIAIDMDETLLRSDKTFDQTKFKYLLHKLYDKNIRIVIASGNSYHRLKDFFDEEDRNKLYFAGDNGNYISYQDHVIYKHGIHRDLYIDITKKLLEIPFMEFYLSVGDRSYMLRDHNVTFSIAKKYNGRLEVIDQIEDIPENKEVYKIAIITYGQQTLENNKKFTQQMNQSFPMLQTITSGNVFIDIIPKDGGKGNALKVLQENLRIPISKTMAFGDSMNDATMMQRSKYTFAMKNADEDLLPYCHYQIGSNNDQAVLEVLTEVLNHSENLTFLSKYQYR